ncbi:MAG: T9SS type A sorting domain-containing protein [Bacteroidota bacterium]
MQEHVLSSQPFGWLYFDPERGYDAITFVAEYKELFGLGDDDELFVVKNRYDEKTGWSHYVYDHYHKGIKVLYSNLRAHEGPNGFLRVLNGKIAAQLDHPTKPSFGPKEAWRKGFEIVNGKGVDVPPYHEKAVRLLYSNGVADAHLARSFTLTYRMEIEAVESGDFYVVELDAVKRDLRRIENTTMYHKATKKVFDAKIKIPNSVSVSSGNYTSYITNFIQVPASSSTHGNFILKDNFQNIVSLSDNNLSSTITQDVINNSFSSGDAITDIYQWLNTEDTHPYIFTTKAAEYFYTKHNHRGIDGASHNSTPQLLKVLREVGDIGGRTVRDQNSNETVIYFSRNKNGNDYASPKTAGHEYFHAIQRTIFPNAILTKESGSIFEGLADIFSIFTEKYFFSVQNRFCPNNTCFDCSLPYNPRSNIWTSLPLHHTNNLGPRHSIPFSVVTRAHKGLRDFNKPTLTGNPESVNSSNFISYSGNRSECSIPGNWPDRCYVHFNSTIVSHAFVIMTSHNIGDGFIGQKPRPFTSPEKGIDIVWHAFLNLSDDEPTYWDLRESWILSSIIIEGSHCTSARLNVSFAFNKVGIGTPEEENFSINGISSLCKQGVQNPTYCYFKLKSDFLGPHSGLVEWSIPTGLSTPTSNWGFVSGQHNQNIRITTDKLNLSGQKVIIRAKVTDCSGQLKTINKEINIQSCISGLRVSKSNFFESQGNLNRIIKVSNNEVSLTVPRELILKVYDLSGRMLFSSESNNHESKFLLSDYPKGIYLIRLSSSNMKIHKSFKILNP